MLKSGNRMPAAAKTNTSEQAEATNATQQKASDAPRSVSGGGQHAQGHNSGLAALPRRPSGFDRRYTVWPPSTTMALPTTKLAASEHNHTTVAAISSGLPILPIGSCAITACRPSAVPPLK